MIARVHLKLSLLLVLTGLFVSLPLMAADDVDKLSAQLVKLRGEVDDLTTELSLSREEHKQQMKYLYLQQSDLKSQKAKQKSSIERLQVTLKKHQQKVNDFGADSKQLQPILLNSITQIERYIRMGLPYKLEDRLHTLRELKAQINSQVITAQKAANILWSIVEDEISLSKENGLFKQVVEINGEEYLASVARVGMMLMYFKTSDGVYGKADKKSGQWTYVVLNEARDKKDIDQLIDAYKKQIRMGYFELPSASIL